MVLDDSLKMTTRSGKWISPLHLTPDDVEIEDIAHHLSMLCRWGGATCGFFSVGEHSINVSRLCSPEDALWGLLHDGAEAYLGDVITPVKRAMRRLGDSGYDHLEERVLSVIANKFGLPPEMPESVKRADEVAWREELSTLLPGAPHPIRVTMSPALAREEFLSRFKELRAGRE